MTQVVSAKSPKDETMLYVGQLWTNENNDVIQITELELLPYRDATNNNTRVTYTINASNDLHSCKFIDFVTQMTVSPLVVTLPKAGLHEHHLTDVQKTIAVGQHWQHYKGEVYVIVDVSLDANVGCRDFCQARVSYRSTESSNSYTWNLSVSEFLCYKTGKPRFEQLPRSGRDRRNVQLDRSLKHFWRKAA